MDKLLEVLMSAKLDKKPTVDELAKLAEVEKVSGAERDEAWDKYQQHLAEQSAGNGAARNDGKTAGASNTNTADQTQKSDSKDDKSAYRVTVKRDGFRRLNRAWSGTTELKKSELSAGDLKVLEADPMFVVEKL